MEFDKQPSLKLEFVETIIMKNSVVWAVTQSTVWSFGCKMKAAGFPEFSVNVYETERRHIHERAFI
jgi:hypothetical protein